MSDYTEDGAWMSEQLSAAVGEPMRVIVGRARLPMYDEDNNELDETCEEVAVTTRRGERSYRIAGEPEQYDRGLMYQMLEFSVMNDRPPTTAPPAAS